MTYSYADESFPGLQSYMYNNTPAYPAAQPSNYGNAQNWAAILQAAGQGAGQAMQGLSTAANSKEEAREAKRRTLGHLFTNALKRNSGLRRGSQQRRGELADLQSQMLQDVARGFVSGMQGQI